MRRGLFFIILETVWVLLTIYKGVHCTTAVTPDPTSTTSDLPTTTPEATTNTEASTTTSSDVPTTSTSNASNAKTTEVTTTTQEGTTTPDNISTTTTESVTTTTPSDMSTTTEADTTTSDLPTTTADTYTTTEDTVTTTPPESTTFIYTTTTAQPTTTDLPSTTTTFDNGTTTSTDAPTTTPEATTTTEVVSTSTTTGTTPQTATTTSPTTTDNLSTPPDTTASTTDLTTSTTAISTTTGTTTPDMTTTAPTTTTDDVSTPPDTTTTTTDRTTSTMATTTTTNVVSTSTATGTTTPDTTTTPPTTTTDNVTTPPDTTTTTTDRTTSTMTTTTTTNIVSTSTTTGTTPPNITSTPPTTTTDDVSTLLNTSMTTSDATTSVTETTTLTDNVTTVSPTAVPNTDDVKDYIIIVLSVALGLLIVGIIIYFVYARITRTSLPKDAVYKPDLVTTGTQTDDDFITGLRIRALPPISTNMKLISEKTRHFEQDEYLTGEKQSKSKLPKWSFDQLYYPDAPPIVPKQTFDNKDLQFKKYHREESISPKGSQFLDQKSDSWSQMTDQYRNAFGPHLFVLKQLGKMPDVERPSTSTSECSMEFEKKTERVSTIQQTSVLIPKSSSPDRAETSSGFSEEQTPPLSTQPEQKDELKSKNESEHDAKNTSLSDFESILEETAVDLQIPVVGTICSPRSFAAWKQEHQNLEHLKIENKNPKFQFHATTEDSLPNVDEETESSTLMTEPDCTKSRSVSFNLQKTDIRDLNGTGEQPDSSNGSLIHGYKSTEGRSFEVISDTKPTKKKRQRSNVSRKQMGEEILFSTYGFPEHPKPSQIKRRKSSKKRNRAKKTMSYEPKKSDDNTATTDTE